MQNSTPNVSAETSPPSPSNVSSSTSLQIVCSDCQGNPQASQVPVTLSHLRHPLTPQQIAYLEAPLEAVGLLKANPANMTDEELREFVHENQMLRANRQVFVARARGINPEPKKPTSKLEDFLGD
jgi:hypothetical protein